MDRLSGLGGAHDTALLHGDVQASNVMVAPDGRYMGVLDWGSAGTGDPAWDFAGVPLRVVPWMLAGYRTLVAPEEGPLEARIVLRSVHLALFLSRRGPMPERTWAERPLGMWVELLCFFSHPPAGPWADLGPGLRRTGAVSGNPT